MTNTELRIGNFIKKNNEIITVDEQTMVDIKENPEEYRPIHIYKSILHKLGFEGHNVFTFKNMELHLVDGRNHIFFKSKYRPNVEYLTEIKFIHQLQNLYYALTREELIFEDKK